MKRFSIIAIFLPTLGLLGAIFVAAQGFSLETTFIVNHNGDAPDANPGDGECETIVSRMCTLRAAVQETNALPGRDVIILPVGIYQLSVPGLEEDESATGDLDITDDLSLIGAGPAESIVDGGGIDRVFHIVGPDNTVDILNLTVRNGAKYGGAGIANSHSNLTLDQVVVSANDSYQSAGGGIFSNGVLTISNSIISENTSGTNNGGGIANFGIALVVNTRISNNFKLGTGNGIGIYNRGEMMLLSSQVVGNAAGAGSSIYSQGTMTISHSSVLSQTIGGIRNDSGGNLLIMDSNISHNIYPLGAGILNQANLVIVRSLIHGNISPNGTARGGGLYNIGTATLTNVTISGNSVAKQGGGIANRATLTVTNSTIISNTALAGTGIWNDSGDVVILKNTIVANSGDNCSGTMTSAGHNLDSGNNCGFAGSGDLINTNPLLDPLQDNGGPTETYALLPSSKAIDAGDNNSCPSTDQRGAARPVDGDGNSSVICDIGAYEYDSAVPMPTPTTTLTPSATPPTPGETGTPTPTSTPPPTGTILVNTINDAIDIAPGDGICESAPDNDVCSLRGAIQETNALAGRQTVIVPAGFYYLTLGGPNEDAAAIGDLDISDDLVLNGAGEATTIFYGNGSDRIVHVLNGPAVAINGVTIQNGILTGTIGSQGGGINHTSGHLTLDHVVVSGNQVEKWGAGIYNSGSLTLTYSAILSNSIHLEGSGGGIYNVGTLFITDSALSNNKSPGYIVRGFGGGILNMGIMTVHNSTISHNYAERGGGGINNGGTAQLVNVTLTGNTFWITGNGSNVVHGVGTMTMTNSTSYSLDGPGIHLYSGQLIIKNTILAGYGDGHACSFEVPAISAGHNLDSGDGCNLNGPGDLSNMNPLLGPFQDNGGPTWTFALLAGSPAIDAGDNNGCPSTDQRGVARPLDGDGNSSAVCDIGAYEYDPNEAAPTATATASPSATPSPTQTATVTPSSTLSPTAGPSATPSPTQTATVTPSPTLSPTATASPSPTPFPTQTATLTPSPTLSPTPTASPSPATITPTATAEPPIHQLYLPAILNQED